MEEGYIKLGDLLVYRLALQISIDAWVIYEKMDWQINNLHQQLNKFIRSCRPIQ